MRDFIKCSDPENKHESRETEQFKSFSYDELMKRDKINLDVFWLKDKRLEDSDNLPEPYVIAREIIENLESALDQFEEIEVELSKSASKLVILFHTI